jgi:O-acetyl-ADP-ribose deacetylase (regulator of RNase III)
MKSRTYQFSKSTLTIQFGDITTSEAEVIVSSDDSYISMGGGVSASILRAGGQEIIMDAAKKVPVEVGDVVLTTAGRLRAKYVFHAITLDTWKDTLDSRRVLKDVLSRCFDLLDLLGLHSIALPAIGAGVAGFAYEDVAAEMANIIAARLISSEKPLKVTVFLFDRFGKMQPMDFVHFFEEFRARVPTVSAHEIRSAAQDGPSSTEPAKVSPVPPEEVTQRFTLTLKLNALTEGRTRLEDRLARLRGSSDKKELQEIRAQLNRIQDERVILLADLQESSNLAVHVFISYAHADEDLRKELGKQLAILQRQGVIRTWTDRKISAGTEWQGQIDSHLNTAQIILLLISPDFIASDYCYDVELKRALGRHDSGEARVIPIILRPTYWENAPFAKLQALPPEAKPVTSWPDRDSALLAVAQGIAAAVQSIGANQRFQKRF